MSNEKNASVTKSPEKVRTPAQQALRRFRKNKIAMIGAVLLILLALFVVIGRSEERV